MSRSWKQGSTRAWRRLRALVLIRDQGKGCRIHADGHCDRVPGRRKHQCSGTQDVVHHVRGKAVTGDDMRWLVAGCAACNRHVGNPADHSPAPKRISRW